MRTTSFAAYVRHFFLDQNRISKREGRTMKLLKGLMVLTAAMGIATSAHAAGGWVTVYPEQIKGVGARNGDYSELKTTIALQNLEGGGVFLGGPCVDSGGFMIEVNSPLHDRAFALLTTAMVTGQKIVAWVDCASWPPVAISVNIYDPNR